MHTDNTVLANGGNMMKKTMNMIVPLALSALMLGGSVAAPNPENRGANGCCTTSNDDETGADRLHQQYS